MPMSEQDQDRSLTGFGLAATSSTTPGPRSSENLAYLKFFALALQSSLNEVRSGITNRVLVLEVLDGLDLLTENLRKRFGFPCPPPNHAIASLRPEPRSQQLRLETNLAEQSGRCAVTQPPAV